VLGVAKHLFHNLYYRTATSGSRFFFIECNIKLLEAFDNETLPVSQGFGSLMDQCDLQSFGRLCERSGASKAFGVPITTLCVMFKTCKVQKPRYKGFREG
jgi:hypothetical protein